MLAVASIFSQCKVNSRSGPGILIAHSGSGSVGSRSAPLCCAGSCLTRLRCRCLLRFVSLMRGSDVEGGDRCCLAPRDPISCAIPFRARFHFVRQPAAGDA
jgi:hypothetical protein